MIQGYNQEIGRDYDEIVSPVARIEAIRLLRVFVFTWNSNCIE